MFAREMDVLEWTGKDSANRKPLARPIEGISAFDQGVALPGLFLNIEDVHGRIGKNAFEIVLQLCFQSGKQISIEIVGFVPNGVAAQDTSIASLAEGSVEDEVRRGIGKAGKLGNLVSLPESRFAKDRGFHDTAVLQPFRH